MGDSEELIIEIPNPNFCSGDESFTLENGDCYIGGFCAHRMGIVWREGPGVYVTKDNHFYEGIWENDQLLESEAKITYADDTEYQGNIVKGKYFGKGTYILDNQLPITGNFTDNILVGEAVLTDPGNRLWKGIATSEEILFRPENHFYINLPSDRGRGRSISQNTESEKQSQLESVPVSNIMFADNLKDIVFKKSDKTVNDFRDTLLTEDDIAYSRKDPCYKNEFKTKALQRKMKSSSNISLLKTFMSKEYRKSVPKMSVFYANV